METRAAADSAGDFASHVAIPQRPVSLPTFLNADNV